MDLKNTLTFRNRRQRNTRVRLDRIDVAQLRGRLVSVDRVRRFEKRSDDRRNEIR